MCQRYGLENITRIHIIQPHEINNNVQAWFKKKSRLSPLDPGT